MQLKPLGDRIVVKPIKEAEKTASGIILPATVDQEKKAEGEVVAIGNGEKITKLQLKVGQHVVYSQYGGSDVKMDNLEYKILAEDDVLAVIE